MTVNAFKTPVILAWMPVSSHTDVNIHYDGNAKSSTYSLPKRPSVALDSGIHAGMTAHRAIMKIAVVGTALAATIAACNGLMTSTHDSNFS
jgi:hypothetical protein